MAKCSVRRSFVFQIVLLSFLGMPILATAADSCTGDDPALKRHLNEQQLKGCLSQVHIIQFATLSGPELMRALNQLTTQAPIRILDSEIEGGLDFSLLRKSAFDPDALAQPVTRKYAVRPRRGKTPAAPSPDLPTSGPDAQQRMIHQLRATYPFDRVIVVASRIEIRDSRVQLMQRFDADSQLSLDAAGVLFTGPVNFSGTTFQGGARFARTAFLADVNFADTSFLNRASFDAAWFGGRSSFARAKFAGSSLFSYARFRDQSVFRGASFAVSAGFENSRFCGNDVDFRDARFSGDAQFPSIRTAGEAGFTGAAFAKGASFLDAEFAGNLDLTNIQSEGLLIFAATSAGGLQIGARGTTYIGATLDFSGSEIHRVLLQNVIFARPVTFAGAQLGQAVTARRVFQNSLFSEDGRMADAPARFACEYPKDDPFPNYSRTDLIGVTFRDDVSFWRATFRGQTTLSEINFNKPADLTEVTFRAELGKPGPKVRFSRVHAETVNIEWKSMPALADLTRGYKDPPVSSMLEELATGYRSRNRPVEALQAKEATGWMQWREARACVTGAREPEPDPGPISAVAAGSGAKFVDESGERCGYALSVFQLIALPIWGFSSGFGTSLPRLLILVFLFDVGFAFFYMRFGWLVRTGGSNNESDAAMRLRFLELPTAFGDDSGTAGSLMDFREAFALSTVILLRFGAKDARAGGSVGRIEMGKVVTAEWALGIFLLLDLVYTLQSQPFAQAILHGVLG
jgi:Pentapeptide repeats (9 copies)